ncbi:hypothetical protein [Xanthobacter pseudotagetidis]|uniref:hypothetical protein n=1 Tax=Xanthobacter pseudotagetidis TaxID=3119911 RepID=UPI00372B1D83
MTIIKPLRGALVALALSAAACAPALAQPAAPHSGAALPDDDRMDNAWNDLLESENGLLPGPQYTALNNLAFQAAIVRVCDGYTLDTESFGKGITGVLTSPDKDFNEKQEKEFGAAVLVAFGARYGLFLAEGNGDKKDFCDAAAKLKATPGDVPLFFK